MKAVAAPWPAAVGVSGGSDSVALMLLLRDWANARGVPPPVVLCVDHGLRSEARKEALAVVRAARKLGLEGRVLKSSKKLPASDIEAAAREVRYRLMGEWAARHRLRAVYVGHTRDDQAETFLLRLARGSGVDGLAAMHPAASYPDPAFSGLKLVRPLLDFERGVLRQYLEERGQAWFEDPMNADPRFSRSRIRNAWPQLEALGLTRRRLAEAAAHLGRARVALDMAGNAVLMRACRLHRRGGLIDPEALADAPRELALRALAGILMLVARKPYRPRFERLEDLLDSIAAGQLGGGRTLHGCRIAPATRLSGKGTLLVEREKTRRTPGKRQGAAPTAS